MMTDSEPIDWKVESQRFDGAAESYDQYRPSYPPELIDTIMIVSGVQPGQKALEIGSGPGIATRLFAMRRLSIVGLEPGGNLLAKAEENLAEFPLVSFVQSRFEDWQAGEARFDLIFSAQAFHWVPVEVRMPKTAALLNDSGWLAIFWNKYPGLPGTIGRELDQVYKELAPEIGGLALPTEEVMKRRNRSLAESGYYIDVVLYTFPWSIEYTTDQYLGLLDTYSDHMRLVTEKRTALYAGVAEVIERHGGVIERPYLGVLHMARRKPR